MALIAAIPLLIKSISEKENIWKKNMNYMNKLHSNFGGKVFIYAVT